MKKIKISLNIDKQLWKEAKKNCIDKNMNYSDYIEKLIKKDLKLT